MTPSAKTASAPAAPSPCATTAACTTSDSADDTPANAVLVLAHDRHVRVLTETGDLIRELTLDPRRNYQPLGFPRNRGGLLIAGGASHSPAP